MTTVRRLIDLEHRNGSLRTPRAMAEALIDQDLEREVWNLANSQVPDERLAAARSHLATPEIINKLKSDPDERVRSAAAQNPNAA